MLPGKCPSCGKYGLGCDRSKGCANCGAGGMRRTPPVAKPATLPNGEAAIELDGEIYAVRKMKPWAEMTEEERKKAIDDGVKFIMGDE